MQPKYVPGTNSASHYRSFLRLSLFTKGFITSTEGPFVSPLGPVAYPFTANSNSMGGSKGWLKVAAGDKAKVTADGTNGPTHIFFCKDHCS